MCRFFGAKHRTNATDPDWRKTSTVPNLRSPTSKTAAFLWGSAYAYKLTMPIASLALLCPSNIFDPGPGDRDGWFSLCQANDEQLMPKANLGAIDDQTDFAQVAQLEFPATLAQSAHTIRVLGWLDSLQPAE